MSENRLRSDPSLFSLQFADHCEEVRPGRPEETVRRCGNLALQRMQSRLPHSTSLRSQ